MNDDKSVIGCNLIVDDDFMNKDVSELVQEDFYLFCVKDNKTYLYKDGVVVESGIGVNGNESAFGVPYTSGTLQEYVDNLLTKLGDNNV